MKCSGLSAISGERIEVEFGTTIKNVDPLLTSHAEDAVFIAPGFVDLQVNGFAGVDFNSPGQNMERALAALFSTGVTRFFPTLITGAPDALLAALRHLALARESLPNGQAIEAIHVEGPHISPEDGPRGAHPKEWVRPPDFSEFQRWQDASDGLVRIVTLSPEWPGSARYIEQITELGVVAAIGHTRATPAQLRDAVAAGATLSTHLGNGAGSRARSEDFIEYQLNEPRLAASFIVDHHHLPDDFLRRALDLKGFDRSILVTDAVAPALCEPGPYMLGSVEVELRKDDRVTLRNAERLAGSSLRMDRAITNVMSRAGVGLAQAVTMASTNPARVGRVPGRLRALQPGSRADLVRFRMDTGRVEVLETWLSGQRVY